MCRRWFFLCLALPLLGVGCVSFGDTQTTTSGSAGMFVSLDRGDTWQEIGSLPTAAGIQSVGGASVYRLVPDPQDPSALYWASRQHGLFFTFNDGKTWQRAPSPLNSGFIYSVAVHPKQKCTLYVTNGQFVYRSIDCSRSWKEIYQHTGESGTIRSLTVSAFGDSPVYMAIDTGMVLSSFDQGDSWQVLRTFRGGVRQIVADPLQPGVLYVAHLEKGLQRSSDYGVTWKDVSAGLATFSGGLSFRGLFFHPYKLNTLFWLSDYGILVSNNGGMTWSSMNILTSPGSVNIYAFAINPRNDRELYYTATVGIRSTLYRTLDGGMTWTTKRLPTGQVPTALHVHPIHGTVLYAGFTIPPS